MVWAITNFAIVIMFLFGPTDKEVSSDINDLSINSNSSNDFMSK